VYGHGNLIFSPDGTCLLSPIGNRVAVFDLVKYVQSPFNLLRHVNLT
jgi:periodic tryptophan protein 2